MKRLIAIILALVTLVALLPASALVSAATVTAKPFYTLNGSKDIKTIAQKTKEDFNNRPDGTRFVNLNLMTKAVHGLVEKTSFMIKR